MAFLARALGMTTRGSPAVSLVHRLARVGPSKVELDLARRFAEAHGWRGLGEAAGISGVAGLVYKSCAGLPCPAEEAADLRAHYVATVADNLARSAAVDELGARLAEKGIVFAPLKGHALIESHYVDLGARRMRDADLLVREGELDAAEEAVFALGYTRRRTPGRERSEARYYQRAYVRPRRSGASTPHDLERIELHGTLCDEARYGVRATELWARARVERRRGLEVASLHPADHLAYVALHAALHAFDLPLSAVVDVATVLRREPALAEEALIVAKRWRAVAAVGHAFGLAHALVGAPLPETFERATRPPPHRALALRILLRDDAMPALRYPLPFRAAQALTLYPLVDSGLGRYLWLYARSRGEDALHTLFARLGALW